MKTSARLRQSALRTEVRPRRNQMSAITAALRGRRVARAGTILRAATRSARERLEDRLDLVMAGAPVEHLDVNVGPRPLREALEEVLHELRLEIAHPGDLELQIDHRVRPPAKIDGGDSERLVHRHHEVPGAIDAAAGAERLSDRLAERDPDVLDGVVLVHVEIAVRLQREIERAVARHQLQHVIEEADPGGDLIPSAPFVPSFQWIEVSRVFRSITARHTGPPQRGNARRVSSTRPAVIGRIPRSRVPDRCARGCRAARPPPRRTSPTCTRRRFATLGQVRSRGARRRRAAAFAKRRTIRDTSRGRRDRRSRRERPRPRRSGCGHEHRGQRVLRRAKGPRRGAGEPVDLEGSPDHQVRSAASVPRRSAFRPKSA